MAFKYNGELADMQFVYGERIGNGKQIRVDFMLSTT